MTRQEKRRLARRCQLSYEGLPIVLADNAESAKAGAELVARGLAYGLIYIDDRPGGGYNARYHVALGQEHRLAVLEGIIKRVVERCDGVLVDAARLVKRGEA